MGGGAGGVGPRPADRDGLGQPLRAGRQRGERRRRPRGDRAHQRRRGHRARRCCTTTRASCPAPRQGVVDFCSRPRPSASSTRRTRRSPAPRWAARARWASPARWPPPAWPRYGGTPGRSRMRPRSAWSTTWASPAIRWAAWCRSRASSVTPSPSVKAIDAARMALRGDGHAPRQPRQGHRDHARDRRRHADQVQGNGPRRPAVNIVECRARVGSVRKTATLALHVTIVLPLAALALILAGCASAPVAGAALDEVRIETRGADAGGDACADSTSPPRRHATSSRARWWSRPRSSARAGCAAVLRAWHGALGQRRLALGDPRRRHRHAGDAGRRLQLRACTGCEIVLGRPAGKRR